MKDQFPGSINILAQVVIWILYVYAPIICHAPNCASILYHGLQAS